MQKLIIPALPFYWLGLLGISILYVRGVFRQSSFVSCLFGSSFAMKQMTCVKQSEENTHTQKFDMQRYDL